MKTLYYTSTYEREKEPLSSIFMAVFFFATMFSGVDLLLRQKQGGDPLSWTNISYVIVTCTFLLHVLRGKPIYITRVGSCAYCLGIWFLSGFFRAKAIEPFFVYLFAVYRGIFLVFMVSALLTNGDRIIRTLRYLVYAGLVSVLGELIQEWLFLRGYGFHFGLSEELHWIIPFFNTQLVRATAFIQDPNVLGSHLLVMFGLLFHPQTRLLELELVNGNIRLIAFPFAILGMLLTFSRGIIISFILYLVWWLASDYKDFGKKIILFLGLSVLIVLMILVLVDSGARSIIDNSLRERIALAVEMLNFGFEHPVFGLGLGNLSTNSQYGGTAHNLYLEIIASCGIVGSFLFIGLLVITFCELNKVITTYGRLASIAAAIKGGLVGFLLSSLFLSGIVNIVFWILISCVAALEVSLQFDSKDSNVGVQ